VYRVPGRPAGTHLRRLTERKGIPHFYLFYVALGLVMHGPGPILYGYVISPWFDRHRGLALGLTMVGSGSGAMIMPSFAQQLIARFGWQRAWPRVTRLPDVLVA
jgi:OFA family oxalate/formate antiporter-like MFS transporter